MPSVERIDRAPLDRDDRQDKERLKAVELAVGQIEKQFGKGSIMRLGQKGAIQPIDAIPTGAISIDFALGVGGVPRGRVVEIFGPESSGKTTRNMRSTRSTRRSSAWIWTTFSSRSPITANRRSRLSRSSSARAAST
jgi:hypothetical protein